MKLNKIRRIISVVFVVFLISGCSKDNRTSYEGISNCELVGNLTHVQYWNENDEWDLKSLFLKIDFDDGSTKNISAADSAIQYKFEPESPVGLPVGYITLYVRDGFIKDRNGVEHHITPRHFENISIVDYPYTDNEPPKIIKKVAKIALPILAGIALVFFYIHAIKIKKY